jgi:hypothetical protein
LVINKNAWGHKYSSETCSFSCKYLGKVLVTVIFPHKDMFADKEFMFSCTHIHQICPTTTSNENNRKLFLDVSKDPGPTSFHPPEPATSKIYLQNHIIPEAYL